MRGSCGARQTIRVLDGDGVRGVVPQNLRLPMADETPEAVQLMFRPACVYENATIRVLAGEQEIYKTKRRILAPGEMADIALKPELIKALNGEDITVRIDASEGVCAWNS